MTVHDLARALPEIPPLRNRCKAYAMLDAIISPEWVDRYYSFNSRWLPGEETADLVRRLNPDLTLADLAEDLAEIGYPGGR